MMLIELIVALYIMGEIANMEMETMEVL